MVPLFTPISSVQWSLCGSPLKINEHYDRFIISSLWNTRTVGETFTEGLTDIPGRAPCPATLWKYEQKLGRKLNNRIPEEQLLKIVSDEDNAIFEIFISFLDNFRIFE